MVINSFNYKKREKAKREGLAEKAKLEREVVQRIEKALGRVIVWIQNTLDSELNTLVDDAIRDTVNTSTVMIVKAIQQALHDEMKGSTDIERERTRATIRDYPKFATYTQAREGLIHFTLQRKLLKDMAETYGGNGLIEDSELRSIYEGKINIDSF